MKKPNLPKFVPEDCTGCGQTTDYDIALDRGTALIVLALYNAVRLKGENCIHAVKEMVVDPREYPSYREMVQDGKMSFRMMSNIGRPRYHGLIAFVDKGTAEYLLTPKGANFLWGRDVPRVAVVDKKTHTKKFYWNEEEDRVTFGLLMKEAPFWDLNERSLAVIGGWTPLGVAPQLPLAV